MTHKFTCRYHSLVHGGQAKPKRGRKRKFTPSEEHEMSEYLDEFWNFGIPRTKEAFGLELVNYMQCYKIMNTFPNLMPGW